MWREQWTLALRHLSGVIVRSDGGDGGAGGSRVVVALLGLRGKRRGWKGLLISVLIVVGRVYGDGALLIGVVIGHLLMHGELW